MIKDEVYDKYVSIAYQWSQRKSTNTTVKIYSNRHEKYREKEYYVLGIGVSNFLEAKGYDAEKDWVNDENLNHDTKYSPKELIKYIAVRALSLSMICMNYPINSKRLEQNKLICIPLIGLIIRRIIT